MRGAPHLLVAAILAFWMAPNVAAVAVGIHLLIDHHDASAHSDADDEHGHEVIASTSHRHEVLQSRRSTAPRPAVAAFVAPAICLSSAADVSRTSPAEIVSTSAPPAPLFLSHCSLLI